MVDVAVGATARIWFLFLWKHLGSDGVQIKW